MNSSVIIKDFKDHILTITINRPEARNSINAEVSIALGAALEEAENDTSIRAIILTGSGDKAFCAGADLKELAQGHAIDVPDHHEWGFAGYVSHYISVPTIAAVNGFALGGGSELVLASDIAVAAESAKFGFPEVSRGIIAAGGGVVRLSHMINNKKALELLFTGKHISAPEALELGLVNAVVPDDQLLTKAHEYAVAIAQNAPLAVRAAKRVAKGIQGKENPSEADRWKANNQEFLELLQTADAMEGTNAFAQKRAPQWSGK